MPHTFNKVGVIGAGAMGSLIAAHMAGCGLSALLLDIVPELSPDTIQRADSPTFRNQFAQRGLNAALMNKPPAFYLPEEAEFITIGNLEDDLGLLGECDWIVEAVVEDLEIKKSLLARLEGVLKPGARITTNTSGISIADMGMNLSPESQKNFFGTHFFNPPRYMKLLEIIPNPQTSPEILSEFADFAQRRLGKGVVWAKDTPGFIANRIGMFTGCQTVMLMHEMGLTIEEVDALTGPALGRPKMATFRLADLVGLEVMGHVAKNIYDNCPQDDRRDVFVPPPWFSKMIDKGLLGQKKGRGFYKKIRDKNGESQILALDYETLSYRPRKKPGMNFLQAASMTDDPKQSLKSLFYAPDAAGRFVFRHLSEVLLYTANRVPEISDDIVNIDRAMKWGFNWQYGPFEIWDILGIDKSVKKMEQAGYAPPSWVEYMLSKGENAFYRQEGSSRFFHDFASQHYWEIEQSPDIIYLPSLKDRQMTVLQNPGASLIDLGDGVACLEFHTKMNAMGHDIVNMLNQACDLVPGRFDGLVIANHGENFSVGANLMLVLFTAQEDEWDELDWMIRTLQNTFMRLKYLERPVVAAPHHMALGGGCELCLACDRVVAASETYMGLVEVGVGVIPAGGGTKELLIRNTKERLFTVGPDGIFPKQIFLLPFVARTMETIAMAKVATSAKEAVKLGMLRPTDKIAINSDFRIKTAKDNVLALNLEGYAPKRPLNNIRVMGKDSLGVFQYGIYNMRRAGYITDHDVDVATKLAKVLTGGDVLPDTEVSEQYLLDLEREAFLSLCGTPKTQARMAHMLKTGKPLRN